MRFPMRFHRKKAEEVTWQQIRAWHEEKGPVALAYSGILRKLFLDPNTAEQKVLLVTSAAEGDGKTMTCLNLAAALALRGDKVLLVDAHFCRPRLGQHLGLEGSPGLTDLSHGNVPVEPVVPDPALPGLHAVPCGNSPRDLGDAASCARFTEFLKKARGRYDLVLMDGPPVAAGVEPMTLGRLADGVIFIIAVDRTQKTQAVFARNLIQRNGGRIAGVVMNHVPAYLPDFYTTP